jgi:SAM-dependent methyltransferase
MTADDGSDVDGRWRAPHCETNWEATYQRGQWDYLDGIGEVPRYAVLAGYVHKLLDRGAVLDAGCGEAILARYLDLGRFTYDGIDVSPTAIERARTRVRARTLTAAAIETFAPPAETLYAAVVFGDSLQHMATPLESVDRYRAFLRPDGFVIISLYAGGNGPRLGRLFADACGDGRYTLVDRAKAVSISHGLEWDILVVR